MITVTEEQLVEIKQIQDELITTANQFKIPYTNVEIRIVGDDRFKVCYEYIKYVSRIITIEYTPTYTTMDNGVLHFSLMVGIRLHSDGLFLKDLINIIGAINKESERVVACIRIESNGEFFDGEVSREFNDNFGDTYPRAPLHTLGFTRPLQSSIGNPIHACHFTLVVAKEYSTVMRKVLGSRGKMVEGENHTEFIYVNWDRDEFEYEAIMIVQIAKVIAGKGYVCAFMDDEAFNELGGIDHEYRDALEDNTRYKFKATKIDWNAVRRRNDKIDEIMSKLYLGEGVEMLWLQKNHAHYNYNGGN